MFTGDARLAFGLTEPNHGSDATWLETKAVRDGDEWVINGQKRFNSGLHDATHDMIFARTSGDDGKPNGISCFIVPTDTPGFSVDFMWWTFNMPTDHAEVTLHDVRVPATRCSARTATASRWRTRSSHENRIRQAASGVGAAQYCIDESVAYASERITFGQPLSDPPGDPVAARRAADRVRDGAPARPQDGVGAGPQAPHGDQRQGRDVQLPREPARLRRRRPGDPGAGGIGYTRHMPFEHIYRHHRRYRITEGSEEIQMRKIAQILFGFGRPRG